MGLYYDLPVFKDVYELVKMLFLYTHDFPREYKYTLGQDMKRDGIKLVRSIYRANSSREKVQYLQEFLDDFEILKFEIRLSSDLGILPRKRHAEFSKRLVSIGKQVHGWKRACV